MKGILVGAFIAVLCLSMFLPFTLKANAEVVQASPNSWRSKAPIPNGDVYGAAVVNGIVYVMGSSTNYAYNPADNTWTAETPMPMARIEFAMAACDSKIYVIGGYPVASETSSSVNQVYDPSTNTWANATAMPTGTSEAQANTVDGKIYVIGGRTAAAYSTINVTEIYDPATNSWEIGAPMPYPVVSYASAVVDNSIYVIGGQDEWLPLGQNINVNFTQIYSPSNDTWSLVASIPETALDAGCGATSGVTAPQRIYVFGGSIGFGVGSNQTYAYNPAANFWSPAAAMPNATAGCVVAVVNDLLYVIGGGEGMTTFTTNYQYTPIGYSGAVAPTLSPSTSPSLLTPSIGVDALVAVVITVVAVVFLTFRRRVRTKPTTSPSTPSPKQSLSLATQR